MQLPKTWKWGSYLCPGETYWPVSFMVGYKLFKTSCVWTCTDLAVPQYVIAEASHCADRSMESHGGSGSGFRNPHSSSRRTQRYVIMDKLASVNLSVSPYLMNSHENAYCRIKTVKNTIHLRLLWKIRIAYSTEWPCAETNFPVLVVLSAMQNFFYIFNLQFW